VSIVKRALIALAESVTIIVERSARNRRVAESVVAVDIECPTSPQIVPAGVKSIMKSALRNLGVSRRAAIVPVFMR
jgi:hypothetical protein